MSGPFMSLNLFDPVQEEQKSFNAHKTLLIKWRRLTFSAFFCFQLKLTVSLCLTHCFVYHIYWLNDTGDVNLQNPMFSAQPPEYNSYHWSCVKNLQTECLLDRPMVSETPAQNRRSLKCHRGKVAHLPSTWCILSLKISKSIQGLSVKDWCGSQKQLLDPDGLMTDTISKGESLPLRIQNAMLLIFCA